MLNSRYAIGAFQLTSTTFAALTVSLSAAGVVVTVLTWLPPQWSWP